MQTENKAVYEFTIDFIRKTSAHIEPYIHLVRRKNKQTIFVSSISCDTYLY